MVNKRGMALLSHALNVVQYLFYDLMLPRATTARG